MVLAWKTQMWEAANWHKVRGPAAAVCRDMGDLEVECPRWDTIRVDKENRVNFRYVCQEVVSHTLVTCARESDRSSGKVLDWNQARRL